MTASWTDKISLVFQEIPWSRTKTNAAACVAEIKMNSSSSKATQPEIGNLKEIIFPVKMNCWAECLKYLK